MTEPARGVSLVELLRCRSAPLDGARLRAMNTSAWSEIVEMAARHRITSLLVRRFADPELHCVIPASARAQLDLENLKAAVRGAQVRAQLPIVVRALAAHAIPTIVLKGGYLTFHVYQDA